MELSQRFENKVALITGGGSGLGRAIALRLAQDGASVGIAGRRAEKIADVCQEIKAKAGQAIDIRCDVMDEAQCDQMVEQVITAFGRLDVLVTSAGIPPKGGQTVVDTPVDVWEEIVNTDLRGNYLCAKYTIPEMRKVHGGAIIVISSIGGCRGSRGGMALEAAQGGLINLTRHLAVAHAAENIRVNCICPGVILTPMTAKWLENPRVHEVVSKRHPMRRVGEAREVAAAAAFLASDEASFITGAALPVDGGFLAMGLC